MPWPDSCSWLFLQVTTGLVGLAELPALKTVSLHGCTAATQAADTALNKLLKALKSARPQRVKVRHHPLFMHACVRTRARNPGQYISFGLCGLI